jgi:hypothetical protein
MTTSPPATPETPAPAGSATHLPPDPEQYDAERNVHARARGLAAPYIAGGRDPEPEAGLAEERRLLRWLLIMVVALVLSGFVVGIVINIVELVA